MQVSVAGLRRNIKNIAHNYTEPQKKVREATSNDPWGPSSTLMSEIADMTHNGEAFSQIMEMLWKRLNDHGKNWRHVYKSLVLLEYLIKTGSEKVAQQCKENIFAIQTLKDFHHFDENKDQGLNVREKAKQLVILLNSDERLKNERERAKKARQRFAQTISGFGSSDSNETTPTSPVLSSNIFGSGSSDMVNGHTRTRKLSTELEHARPQTAGEEELQLQLALAMSKEEAEQEEKRRRSDDLRLQMALSQSQSEQEIHGGPSTSGSSSGGIPVNGVKLPGPSTSSGGRDANSSALVDLLDVDLGGGGAAAAAADPWGGSSSAANSKTNDAWSSPNSAVTSPQIADPWGRSEAGAAAAVAADPWLPVSSTTSPATVDPWAPVRQGESAGSPLHDEDEFDIISKRGASSSTSLTGEGKPYDMDPLGQALLTPMNMSRSNESSPTTVGSIKGKKDPLEFLGENSNLVNLDNLLPSTSTSSSMMMPSGLANPFAPTVPPSNNLSTSQPANPFQTQTNTVKPTINEIRERQMKVGVGGVNTFNTTSTPSPVMAQNNPWSPVKTENPFFNN